MKVPRGILLFCVLSLSACTTFHGVTAVSPEVGNPKFPPTVDSLQPTLKWELSDQPDVTFDLIIYEGLVTESFWRGTERSVGKQVYYREGLTEREHHLAEALKPSTEYYWAVRTRRNDAVSPWSRYDYFLFLGTAWVKGNNLLFMFKTPSEPTAKEGT